MNLLDRVAVHAAATFNHAILADWKTDPFGILKSRNYNSLGSASNTSTAFYLLDLGSLFYVLKKNALIVGVIVVTLLLVSMLYISKAEVLADRKKDVEHKLFILFLICSSVTIFGWMKELFDTFLL